MALPKKNKWMKLIVEQVNVLLVESNYSRLHMLFRKVASIFKTFRCTMDDELRLLMSSQGKKIVGLDSHSDMLKYAERSGLTESEIEDFKNEKLDFEQLSHYRRARKLRKELKNNQKEFLHVMIEAWQKGDVQLIKKLALDGTSDTKILVNLSFGFISL